MEGTKHLIECHCVLPQYRNKKDTVYHKFIVFSIIDDSNTVVPKYVQCNNCSVIHKVYDLCKSEIAAGKDELRSVSTKDEVALSIREDIKNVLISYDCDLATWENVKFILENKKWGSSVVLVRDVVDHDTVGKILVFEAGNRFKIEDFIFNNEV